MTKYEYYECGVIVYVAYFWVNSAGCSGEFHVVFKHFENLENFILNILTEKLPSPWLVGSFFPENLVKPLEQHSGNSHN